MKYYLAFIIPIATIISIHGDGLWTYSTVLLSFGIIPFVELLLKVDRRNLSEGNDSALYDLALYAMVPFQYYLLFSFVSRISLGGLSAIELTGITLSMGIQCGAIGINVAHELGHRSNKFERRLANALLLTSLYMHFSIEHNRGHHKKVGTHADPATARLNENIYSFWIRTVFGSIRSAWQIERLTQIKKGRVGINPRNQMVQFAVVEFSFVLVIGLLFGLKSMLAFIGAAIIGILLLETVNYIEHYGLIRREVSPGQFEKVQPKHSWNSDYPIGRIILFELTRHSNHHYKASKKYQTLAHMEGSPQLPAGYPAMMLLSLIPPLWFNLINKRIPK